MLNKKEFVAAIIDFANMMDCDPSELLVSHGGAMLLMGHKKSTKDIDLYVSTGVWVKAVRSVDHAPIPLGNGVWMLPMTTNIDIFVGGADATYPPIKHKAGFMYTGHNQTLLDYQRLNRPKDQENIRILTS